MGLNMMQDKLKRQTSFLSGMEPGPTVFFRPRIVFRKWRVGSPQWSYAASQWHFPRWCGIPCTAGIFNTVVSSGICMSAERCQGRTGLSATS